MAFVRADPVPELECAAEPRKLKLPQSLPSEPFSTLSEFRTCMMTLPEPKTDAELMQSLLEGQVRALGAIYDRHSGLVYTLALQMLLNPQDAEDLTQDIFLYLWRHPKVYCPERGSLPSYLATLTRSRAIDRLRTRTSKLNFLTRWQCVLGGDRTTDLPLSRASELENADRLHAALLQLPSQQREVLQQRFFEGYTFSEIASRLGIPLGTVKTRSRQGLLSLRKILAKSEELTS